MTTKINSKTPDEIKKGLECCKPVWVDNHWKTCDSKCPYIKIAGKECKVRLYEDALAYIQQLERERDAAVEQLRVGGRSCTSCRFAEDNLENAKVCEECQVTLSDLTYSNWQWRGVQEVE